MTVFSNTGFFRYWFYILLFLQINALQIENYFIARHKLDVSRSLYPFSGSHFDFSGGENIKEIKERSDAAVVVSQNNVRFPGTNERVISIRGSMDAIKICVNMIQEKIRYSNMTGLYHMCIVSYVYCVYKNCLQCIV